MITGYNTDVKHRFGVVHVQTEDKGRATPTLESLIYVGGQVVASQRSAYADLLTEDHEADEVSIAERMDEQHREMVAGIRAGKFDSPLARVFGVEEKPAAPVATVKTQEKSPASPVTQMVDGQQPVAATANDTAVDSPLALAKEQEGSRSLDQVILDYLEAGVEKEQLVLKLDIESELALGQEARLVLRTLSSATGEAVQDAAITVKLISTVRAPQTLAHGKTSAEGVYEVALQLPEHPPGTTALIISAASQIGESEIKHLL